MRYLFGFLCVCALVGTLPQSVGAQAGEEGTSAKPNAEEPVQSTEPTGSRLERSHPEALPDPSKPKPTSTPGYVDPLTGALLAMPEGTPRVRYRIPAMPGEVPQMPTALYVDPLTGALLAMPEGTPVPQMPTAPPTEEQKRKSRRVGIGVGVSIGLVVIGALVLGVAAASVQ